MRHLAFIASTSSGHMPMNGRRLEVIIVRHPTYLCSNYPNLYSTCMPSPSKSSFIFAIFNGLKAFVIFNSLAISSYVFSLFSFVLTWKFVKGARYCSVMNISCRIFAILVLPVLVGPYIHTQHFLGFFLSIKVL